MKIYSDYDDLRDVLPDDPVNASKNFLKFREKY
jgi:hypothetical protein